MKKFFRENRWWLIFTGSFITLFTFILIFIYFKEIKLNSLKLEDWLNFFVSASTIGGFIYLIIDKILIEKENKANQEEINSVKWQENIPFLVLNSPCDPTLNYCDIDINSNENNIGRGNEYFSISNLSKVNAFDITVQFASDKKYNSIFNKHFISFICPLQSLVANGSQFQIMQMDKGEQMTTINEDSYVVHNYQEKIYSKYNVDPQTKEISNSEFKICDCLSNCNLTSISGNEKYFYVRLNYYTSFNKKYRYSVNSDFKVFVICNKTEAGENSVTIKGITLLDYKYKLVNK